MDGVLSKLKNLDAYPKVNEDFFSRTSSGGVITVVSSLVMLGLFFSELGEFAHWYTSSLALCMPWSNVTLDCLHAVAYQIHVAGLWLRMNTISELSVDTSRGEMMDINVSIVLAHVF